MKLRVILTKLTQDNGSWWVFKLYNWEQKSLKYFSGFVVEFSSHIKGIKIGRKNKFYGLTYFQRFPFSSITIGSNCTLRSDHTSNLIGVNHKCIISTHHRDAQILIGDNCGFSGVSIGAALSIRIGNNVKCGANVIITDWDWHPEISQTNPKPVIIQDNVWIGVNTTVLKGVTIGENSIIGANSLVIKDIPANVIAGGNPCRILKKKNQ